MSESENHADHILKCIRPITCKICRENLPTFNYFDEEELYEKYQKAIDFIKDLVEYGEMADQKTMICPCDVMLGHEAKKLLKEIGEL